MGIKPVVYYYNAELLKKDILKDNRNKSGIYRWTNLINNKTYVGSGKDLSKRLTSYFNPKELIKQSRPINIALLKYGFNNFSLDILEYCSLTSLLEREQYYLDLLVPDYNILKYAYSLLGFKHSEETIEKLKNKIISPEHREVLSKIHQNKFVSEDTRNKLSIATAKYKKDNPLTPEALVNITNKSIEREGVSVSVLNTETNELTHFITQTEASKFLGITRSAVYNAIKKNSKVKGIYLILKK